MAASSLPFARRAEAVLDRSPTTGRRLVDSALDKVRESFSFAAERTSSAGLNISSMQQGKENRASVQAKSLATQSELAQLKLSLESAHFKERVQGEGIDLCERH